MTVTYTFDVTRNSWTSVLKVLFRWRGSVWKSVWKELFIWLVFYYIIMLIYRSPWILTDQQQSTFGRVSKDINDKLDWIPLNFLLGFFVNMIVDRWRQIFLNMGYMENVALSVATLCRQKKDTDVLYRRAIVRYLTLSQVLVLRDISLKVRRRFPNLDAIVESGFMETHEREYMEGVKCHFNKYWVPVNWSCAIIMNQRETGSIQGDNYLNSLLQEVKNFRSGLALLQNFDWVPVPLSYPQLVLFAVRCYFMLCLIARQFVIDHDILPDQYVPYMTILQFLFYTGWTKVAESMMNPLGEDDDHFECNYLIDRNIEIGLAIVDDTHDHIPALRQDRFKLQSSPLYPEEHGGGGADGGGEKPYTLFSGSVSHLTLAREEDKVRMVPVSLEQTEDDDSMSVSSMTSRFTSIRRRIRRLSHVGRRQSMPAHLAPSSNNNNNNKVRGRGSGSSERTEDFFDVSYGANSFPSPFSSSIGSNNKFNQSAFSRKTSQNLSMVEEDEEGGSQPTIGNLHEDDDGIVRTEAVESSGADHRRLSAIVHPVDAGPGSRNSLTPLDAGRLPADVAGGSAPSSAPPSAPPTPKSILKKNSKAVAFSADNEGGGEGEHSKKE